MKKILLFLVVPSSLLSMDKPTISIHKRSQHHEARIAFQLALAAHMIEDPDAPSLEEMQEAIEVFSSACTPRVLGVRVFRQPTPPIEDRIFKAPPRDVETESIEPLPFLFAPFPDGSSDKKPPLDIRKASAEIPRDPEWENDEEIPAPSTEKRKKNNVTEPMPATAHAMIYEIRCPYAECSYLKKNIQDAEQDARWTKTNAIYSLYQHVKNNHTQWSHEQLNSYVETHLRSYPTNTKVAFEKCSFEIQCPQCTYQKITRTRNGFGSKRAYTNTVDCLRAHVKKYHPEWTNEDIREYITKNIFKRRYP